MSKTASVSRDSTARIGFEAKFWLTNDKLRKNRDASETSKARRTSRQVVRKGERGVANQYKHVVVDLICFKNISEPACGPGDMFVQSEKIVEFNQNSAPASSTFIHRAQSSANQTKQRTSTGFT